MDGCYKSIICNLENLYYEMLPNKKHLKHIALYYETFSFFICARAKIVSLIGDIL